MKIATTTLAQIILRILNTIKKKLKVVKKKDIKRKVTIFLKKLISMKFI